MSINVIVEIRAKAGHEPAIRKILEELVPSVRKEDGCESYLLYVDRANPAVFYTYESWSSDAQLTKHIDGVKSLIGQVLPMLEGAPKITPLDHLV